MEESVAIVGEEMLHAERPDYVIVLPWNLKTEIFEQLEYGRRWGGTLVTAIPLLEVV